MLTRPMNAYSADFRWRMVYQVKGLVKSYQECLNIDKSTVSRIMALYESRGDVAPNQYPSNSGTSILTEYNLRTFIRPGTHLCET